MHSLTFFMHNFSGKPGGTIVGVSPTYPQPSKTTLFIHLLFTISPLRFAQPMWRIIRSLTEAVKGFPLNPQALLLLSTSFKNLMGIVKELFSRFRLTIISGQREFA